MKQNKIAVRLLTWLLLVALVPVGIVCYLGYRISEEALREEVINSLRATTESKADHIRKYTMEKITDIATLAHSPSVSDALERFETAFKKGGFDSPEYIAVENDLRPFLSYIREKPGYYNFYLITFTGDIVFAVVKEDDCGTNLITGCYKDSELAKVFDRAKTLLETDISEFKHYSPSNGPAVFIASPILKNGKFIGVVAFQMNNKEIYKLVQDYTGLGETGDIVMASRVGDAAVFVTPTRHDPHAAFKRKVPIGSGEALHLQEAVQGKSGSGFAIDYRKKNILAVWRYLPSLRWGMVVKIDVKEAFAPVIRLRNWSLTIGIVAALLIILEAYFISKLISYPIVELTQITKSIAAGDLTQRINIKTEDEIGELADSFNKMVVDLKHSRDALEERAVELERSNKELEHFAYIASHDLQEPLRKVRNYTELLAKRYEGQLDEKADKFIHYAVDGATRMQGLINDLLTYSRVGTQGKELIPTDSAKILALVLDNLQISIEKSGGKVTHDPLPTVLADTSQLGQLFQNLVSNAIKFHGEESPRVHISAKQKGDRWLFSVRDNGIGIESKYNERIFILFQRLHGRGDYPGTGIGLAVCKKIVERHKGEMWIDSALGKGTTFYFTLPGKEWKIKS